MAKLTVAKAMKRVSRTKGKISDLTRRMEKCLNTIESNEFIEVYETLSAERAAAVVLLTDLKNRIMKVNIEHNMFEVILKLSECKNEIEMLRGLSIKQGIVTDRFGEGSNSFKSQMTVEVRNAQIDALQEQINDVTDELDAFNATTIVK